jgi:hypothetical protein
MSILASAACLKRTALPRTSSQSIKAWGFAKRGASRRLFSSREQHGDYAGDENAVECARTAD